MSIEFKEGDRVRFQWYGKIYSGTVEKVSIDSVYNPMRIDMVSYYVTVDDGGHRYYVSQEMCYARGVFE